jgi:hypothetical protein
MKLSTNRYIEVLSTYIRRPMFLGLGVWIVLFEAAMYYLNIDNGSSLGRWGSLGDYLPILIFCSCLFLPSAIGSAVVFHAREQLASWRNTLTPSYRTPHLVIAGAVFMGAFLLLITVFFLLSDNQYNQFDSIYISLLLVSMLFVAGAFWWAFRSMWILLLLSLLAIATPLLIRQQQIDHYSYYYENSVITFTFLSVPISVLFMAIVLRVKLRSRWSSGILGLLAVGYPLLILLGYNTHFIYPDYPYFIYHVNFYVQNFAYWSVFISTLILAGAFWMVFRSSGLSLLLGSLIVMVPLLIVQIVVSFNMRLIVLYGDDFNGLVYPLLIIGALMIASGWWASFRSLWISFLLGPLMIVVPLLIMNEIINYFARSNSAVERISDSVGNLFLEFLPPILIMAFIALGWKLAKGSRRTGKTPRRFMGKDAAIGETTMKPVPPTTIFVHRPMVGFWTRSRRRRVSVLGPGATWAMAGFLAVALTLLAKMFLTLSDVPYDGRELLIHMSLILITITPAIAITLIWRERLPFLATESLYPAARRKFIWEMAAALAKDFLSFWLTITAATLAPLAYFMPECLKDPTFWICVAASAVMQVLAYGAIACAMSFRSRALTVFAPLIILGLMVFPNTLELTASPIKSTIFGIPTLDAGDVVNLSLAVLPIGVILALVAYYRWRRIELA